MSFGIHLRKIRKLRGLTLVELADMTGVSQSYLSHIENEQRGVPSIEILQNLSSALNVDYIEILGKAGFSLSDEDTKHIMQENERLKSENRVLKEKINKIKYVLSTQ